MSTTSREATNPLNVFDQTVTAWPRRPILISCAVVIMMVIWVVSWQGLQPTPPKAADSSGFSAIRALTAARFVLGEQPRPVASAANIAAVARLKEYFVSLGYAPQEQIATVKVPGRGEVTLRNIFIRKEGRQQLPAILLVSHHDSVAGSPGGSDNGMGVAVCLDVARMLTLQETPERPVIILVTDGEEAGLLGAKLFAQNHAWANDIGAVINIDNRGGDGPAQLFETGPNDLALINAIAPHITHPVMGSFFVEVYRRMPNGTDLTAFLARGQTGINIACTGAIARYHTSADTFNVVNLAALQHEGDMATQALSGLCAMPADAFPSDSAVFIDVFGRFIVAWPARSGVVLSFAALLGVVGFGAHVARKQVKDESGGLFTRDYFKGAIAVVVSLLATIVLVMAVSWIMERMDLFGRHYAERLLELQTTSSWTVQFASAYWPPHGILVYVFLAVICVPVSWLTANRLLRDNSPWKSWCGIWSALAIFNLVISFIAPGVGAILLPLVISAGCAAWLGASIFGVQSVATSFLAILFPIVIAATMYAPLEILSWSDVGLSMPLFRGILSGLYATFLLMLFAVAPASQTLRANTAMEHAALTPVH